MPGACFALLCLLACLLACSDNLVRRTLIIIIIITRRDGRVPVKVLLPSSFFLLPSSFFLLPSSFFLLVPSSLLPPSFLLPSSTPSSALVGWGVGDGKSGQNQKPDAFLKSQRKIDFSTFFWIFLVLILQTRNGTPEFWQSLKCPPLVG